MASAGNAASGSLPDINEVFGRNFTACKESPPNNQEERFGKFPFGVDSHQATPGFDAELFCGGKASREGRVQIFDTGGIPISKALK